MIAQNSTDQMLKDIFDISPEERARRNAALIKVLDSFLEGDEQEQRETLAVLTKAMNDDRPASRKLFPDDVTPEERARRRAALDKALDSLLEGDAEEQRETFEYLKKALDEDRPADRKLFSK